MTQAGVNWTAMSLRRALSLGLAAGLAEAVTRLSYRYVGGRMRINAGLDVLFMAPVADAVVFSIVALILVAALGLPGRRLAPATKVALVTGALVALTVWSITERVPQIGRRSGALLGLGAGVAVGGSLRRRGQSASVIDYGLVPLGATVAVLACAVIGARVIRERRALAALVASDSGLPNVLLLILDTARAQSMSVHGYQRPTTPVLESLADSGVRFDRAFSTAPWTLPAHASMFTGRYAHELSADWISPLDLADRTLAERFRDAGYVTGGFVGNYVASWETGLVRGFSHYEDYQLNLQELSTSASLTNWLGHWPRLRRWTNWYQHVDRRTADAVNARTVRWIRSRGQRPYFAFVNYFDPHEFYLPPAPFATMFGSDTARKNWLIGFSGPLGGRVAYRRNKGQMKPHEVQAELSAYEAAIAYVDSRIRNLLDTLAADGALRNTIVIVTADHGEHFGEHGTFEHGTTLYPQLLHVPLIINAPGRVPMGKRVRDVVTLRDLAATIEQLALGTATMPGSTLASFWDADSTTRSPSAVLASRTVASPTVRPDSMRRGAWATVIGETLVIESVGGSPETEVYDLSTDSLASRNVATNATAQSPLDSARKLYRGLRWKSHEASAGRRK